MKKAQGTSRIRQLFNGDYVKVRGVSPALIDRVQATVEDPKAPIILLDSGEEMVNYQDPEYQSKLQEAEDKRQIRAMHAVILFGMQLVDEAGEPIDPPADRRWERQLSRMGIDWRKEMLDMQGIEEFEDEEDEADARADAYMLYTAFSGHAHDLSIVREISGADAMAQQSAEAQFQG